MQHNTSAEADNSRFVIAAGCRTRKNHQFQWRPDDTFSPRPPQTHRPPNTHVPRSRTPSSRKVRHQGLTHARTPTLNLVTPGAFLILTEEASFLRAVSRKSLISLICLGYNTDTRTEQQELGLCAVHESRMTHRAEPHGRNPARRPPSNGPSDSTAHPGNCFSCHATR